MDVLAVPDILIHHHHHHHPTLGQGLGFGTAAPSIEGITHVAYQSTAKTVGDTLAACVDLSMSTYAMVSGVLIHGPDHSVRGGSGCVGEWKSGREGRVRDASFGSPEMSRGDEMDCTLSFAKLTQPSSTL